jgi:hypothetical protein
LGIEYLSLIDRIMQSARQRLENVSPHKANPKAPIPDPKMRADTARV